MIRLVIYKQTMQLIFFILSKFNTLYICRKIVLKFFNFASKQGCSHNKVARGWGSGRDSDEDVCTGRTYERSAHLAWKTLERDRHRVQSIALLMPGVYMVIILWKKSDLHPLTIAKVWFSTFNYETGYQKLFNCWNPTNLAP